VRRLAADVGADLVHANSIRAGIAASMAARLGGAPAIVHVRDCLPDTRATAAVFGVIRSGASLVLANSRYTADALDGRAGTRVEVLHSPVDANRFDPKDADRDRARAALGVPADAPLAALVGQITPWKGQDTAIRALAHARREQPDLRLLLVGSTKFTSRATRYDNQTYLRELHAMVAELGLEDHVIFAGETADVAGMLAAADLALVPSIEEPFGRVVIEAYAAGRPVIAFDGGGLPEIVADGLTGYLVPARDDEMLARRVLEVMSDDAWREAAGRRCREVVRERFSAQKQARELDRLLGDVLAA